MKIVRISQLKQFEKNLPDVLSSLLTNLKVEKYLRSLGSCPGAVSVTTWGEDPVGSGFEIPFGLGSTLAAYSNT